eukprot:m.220388 g.220388  ORF g.220388 m.220388 type:complete len:387 (-) comp19161_c0_seq1:315-1475(-)
MAFQQIAHTLTGRSFGGGATENSENMAGFGGALQQKKPTHKRAALGEMTNVGKKPVTRGLSQRQTNIAPSNKARKASKPVLPEEVPTPMDVDSDASFKTSKPELPPGVDDIDAQGSDDPQLVIDYVYEVDAYMKKLERKQTVSVNYMAGVQNDVTPNMRTILLDWLVEVHLRFKLQQETLYMTIGVLDRFLALQPIARGKLQLAGVTAMLIASKYEEMYPPEVRDFVWIADNAYTREEIIAMEGQMLAKLDFNLGCPLPLQFLRRVSKATNADAATHHLAKYLLELSLGSYEMCGQLPSEVATSAMYLAHSVMTPTQDAWTPNLEFYSGYKYENVRGCIALMTSVLTNSVSIRQQAVRRKYASSKLLKISELPEVSTFIAHQQARR